MANQNINARVRSWPVYGQQIAAILAVEVVGPARPKSNVNLDRDTEKWIEEFNEVYEVLKNACRT